MSFVFLFFLSLFTLADGYHWFFGLVAHWVEIVFIGILLLAPLIFLQDHGKKLSALFLAFGILVLSIKIIPVGSSIYNAGDGAVPVEDPGKSRFKIVSANINSSNSHRGLLVSYLDQAKADIIILTEVSPLWQESLLPISKNYPYSKIVPLPSNFGMAIFSVFPILEDSILVDRENLIPALSATIVLSGTEVELYAIHPFPPVGRIGSLMNSRYLDTVARRISEGKPKVVACGDFNSTPWSQTFKDFLSVSGLELPDGRGFVRTWPAGWSPVMIPIDHCLSRNLEVLRLAKGPNIGSDHYPLEVEYGVYR